MTVNSEHSSNLPNLPGYRANLTPAAQGDTCDRYQTLYWKDGVAVVVPKGSTSPNIRQLEETFETAKLESSGKSTQQVLSASPRPSNAIVPGWLTHSGDVLRFSAYFTEEVPFRPEEARRIRSVYILHYLEDGTTQVIEPRKNSGDGIVPGVLVKRMHISAAPNLKSISGDEGIAAGPFLGPSSFTVGGSVSIYGKSYHIIDGDAFTRMYMESSGLPQGAALPLPVDQYAEYIAKKNKPSGLSRADPQSPTRYAEILMGRDPGTKKLQKFLEGNSNVLRFSAVWDDLAGALPGAVPVRRPYKFLYYLEDDTVEIQELKEGNIGREFYRFLARAPLPKHRSSLELGDTLAREDCVSPADLKIGGKVEVHGRVFLIHDADNFTKEWCIRHLGWALEAVKAIDVSKPAPPPREKELPPYNGYGDPDDSAYNCKRLIPAAPKTRQRQLPEDLAATNFAALRFTARLIERPRQQNLPEESLERRFVVSFFLSDGTISVYETPVPNSGIVGGKYLERRKAYKAGGAEKISEKDLKVGGTLELHGRLFELLGADPWTLKTLERLSS
ncbi:hypothetical protein Ndes2526B_g06108 [Nannochloris sp. 'desiccata']|nr:putative EF-hand domain-containing protein 1 [Chlorella desiccata (nom. nud.)]